jgi:hypothetical protein
VKNFAASHRVIAVYDPATAWALLLNLRTGLLVSLNPAMGHVWRELENGCNLAEAIGTHVARGGHPPDAAAIDVLARHGMLSSRRSTSRGRAIKLSSREAWPTRRVVATDDGVSWGDMVAASVGFATVIAVAHLPIPFSTGLGLIRGLAGIRRQRPTLTSTCRLVAAARRVARKHPGWADCFEISLAAFVAAALKGQAPDWCFGARFGPLGRHAWLEAENTAVDHERGDSDRQYQAMVRLASRPVRAPGM